MNTMFAPGKSNPNQYLQFLGLSHNPFPNAPDNTDFYISQQNDALIDKLTHAILSRKGFMILSGEIGLGKTTLSRRIIEIIEQNKVETSLILQSFFQGSSLLREIIRDFGIPLAENEQDLSVLMTELNDFLLQKNQEHINCAIVIDDAQNLSIESLELIRMISNLEADREKLVQILLVGQPELLDKLNRHELRQLKSRVAVRQSPLPLSKTEVGKYVQFKMNMAGDPGKIIVKNKSIQRLYQLTKGNLRRINILMDQALHTAFIKNTFTIKPGFIEKADTDLSFQGPAKKKRSFTASLIIFIFFMMILGLGAGAGFFYYRNHQKPIIVETQTAENQAQTPVTALVDPLLILTSPARTTPENKAPSLTKSAPNKVDAAPSQADPIVQPLVHTQVVDNAPAESFLSDSVVSFLSTYDLELYAVEFQRALNQKRLKEITQTIFDETGYQLQILHSLPASIRSTFDSLSSINPDTGTKTFYIFWKPWIKIIKFYSGYRGEEISDLQKLLAETGLYDYNIDGIVGQIIMKSVKEFQQKHNLPVTGFPDSETIFILTNMEKQ